MILNYILYSCFLGSGAEIALRYHLRVLYCIVVMHCFSVNGMIRHQTHILK